VKTRVEQSLAWRRKVLEAVYTLNLDEQSLVLSHFCVDMTKNTSARYDHELAGIICDHLNFLCEAGYITTYEIPTPEHSYLSSPTYIKYKRNLKGLWLCHILGAI
jgi:hypothetical protein